MNASRAQLVERVVRPALERGDVVVCDRFADSTLVYQGSGRGLDIDRLSSVISFATAGLSPDMTILLDLPVEIGLARKHAPDGEGWNRFEAETLAFHSRVRDGYQALANRDPQRWRCIDGLQPADTLSEEIWRAVAERMELEP
jgi:dTMP kinase